MSTKRSALTSYRKSSAFQAMVTDRHTRWVLQAAAKTNFSGNTSRPEHIEERRKLLTEKRLLPGLDEGRVYRVRIPGDKEAVAYAVDQNGFVLIQGWDEPFNPKVVNLLE